MTTTVLPPAPEQAPRGRPWTLLVGMLVGTLAVGAGTGWALTRGGQPVAPVAQQDAAPYLEPVLRTVGVSQGARVPWDRPLSIAVSDGALRAVTATDPDGNPVEGTLLGNSWTSAATLLPGSAYRLSATVVDGKGTTRTLPLQARTAAPARTVHAVLSPGDGKVVGVGQTAIVTLDRAVTDAADRTALVSRLKVSTSPAVEGAWRWMSATELHYRSTSYWVKGTTISVSADFARLPLSGGTWGEGSRSTRFSIGARMVSTVDVAAKTMTVVRDGVLLRTLKVSTGSDKYPTKGGVHLVLEKTKLKTMDSSTIGIPRNGPGGYFLKVPHSVRISYSGEFVHSAPNSVRQQGVANVSHGCVNLSPADAAWFYPLATRGDIVDVVHAKVPPKLYDPGTSDWNIPFSSWAN